MNSGPISEIVLTDTFCLAYTVSYILELVVWPQMDEAIAISLLRWNVYSSFVHNFHHHHAT